ncbi:hypothetical protein AK812_SmicGene21255 [Symbiodinium microadriaticum]|uniref:Uncharacterized protein n=1 Tax=Symbiodinium microadriaticum TaxID=2951 RepID=A0A1Q9DMW0_SYMMI|nr:hypothetical protein AK812_SmicGene21255 [Symbiodinium microadriaticum]CAE7317427.1 unnamed protein product [Symbiodinium microadriaticum]CAE7879478.1 unnamed protein product [Symbiodinium sp. KB8]
MMTGISPLPLGGSSVGLTPNDKLREAIGSCSLIGLAKALEEGADANCVQSGCSSLALALLHENSVDLVAMLLEAGAQLHDQEEDMQLLCALLRTEGPQATETVDALLRPHGEQLASLPSRVGCMVASKLSVAEEAEIPYYLAQVDQNLFEYPKVQVDVKLLRLPAHCACYPSILGALAATANKETLESDTVYAILSAAWVQHRWTSMMDIVLNILNVMMLCITSLNYHGPDFIAPPETVIVVLAALHLKETAEWLFECLRGFYGSLSRLKQCMQGRRVKAAPVFTSGDFLLDTVYCITGHIVICKQLGILDLGDTGAKRWIAFFSGMAWLRMLYSMRGEKWLGPRLLPILAAIKDTAAFFFITTVCVFALAHAYYQLSLRAEDHFPAYMSLIQTFRLGILGDFDLFELEGKDVEYERVADGDSERWVPQDPEPGKDYIYVHLMFFVASIGLAVLLMNIFIAVLGQNLELFQDQAAQLFARSRAKMLLEHHQRPWARIWQSFGARTESREPDQLKWSTDHLLAPCILSLSLLPLVGIFGSEIFMWIDRKFSERGLGKLTTAILCLICPVPLLLSLTMLILVACFSLVFKWESLKRWCRIVFLGLYLTPAQEHFYIGRASSCFIWVFVRREAPKEELRSTRTALEAKMQRMEKKMDQVLSLLHTSYKMPLLS